MFSPNKYLPISPSGLSEARTKCPSIPSNAIDGGLILLVEKSNQNIANSIGAFWIILDANDVGTGFLHSVLDDVPDLAQQYADRATSVECYMANLLVASRRLNFVHLVRQNDVVDYREKGRIQDEKLARTIALIQTQKRELES